MERLINTWASTFYTDIALFVVLLVTLIVAIQKRADHPELRFFPLYISLFIILTASTYFFTAFELTKYHSLMPIQAILSQEYFVALVEYLTFTHFLFNILKSNANKTALKLFTIITSALFIGSYVATYNSVSAVKYLYLHYLYLVESLILLVSAIFYYVELFKLPPQPFLLRSSSFWIVSGLMFYLICTLPVTIISPQLLSSNRKLYINMFSMIYSFYIVLFTMIIKGYLCRPQASI